MQRHLGFEELMETASLEFLENFFFPVMYSERTNDRIYKSHISEAHLGSAEYVVGGFQTHLKTQINSI